MESTNFYVCGYSRNFSLIKHQTPSAEDRKSESSDDETRINFGLASGIYSSAKYNKLYLELLRNLDIGAMANFEILNELEKLYGIRHPI